MGLFDKKDHIKKTKELHNILKKETYLTPEERKRIEEKARSSITQPSGLSKKEWLQKVVRPLEKDTEDKIDRSEASRLKKLGK